MAGPLTTRSLRRSEGSEAVRDVATPRYDLPPRRVAPASRPREVEAPPYVAARTGGPTPIRYGSVPAWVRERVLVVPGDSLAAIADRSGVPLGALFASNPALGSHGRDFSCIHPGDEVLIPRLRPSAGSGGGSPQGAGRPSGSTSGQRPASAPTPAPAGRRPPARPAAQGSPLPSQTGVLTSEQLSAACDRLTPAPAVDRRTLPETKSARLALVRRLHEELGVRAPSERLTERQLERLFDRVGTLFGLRPEFLRYMAEVESSGRQAADNGAAHGIMQIERSVHRDAYSGSINVGNDTVANVVYGALLRAQGDRTLAKRFRDEGLPVPTRAVVVEFLGDLAYNRGPALLTAIAKHAKAQGIDVNRFADYAAGAGGRFELQGGMARALPQGGSGVSSTGAGSVLARALTDVNRRSPVHLGRDYEDRNRDGQISHLDIWITRGLKYVQYLHTVSQS